MAFDKGGIKKQVKFGQPYQHKDKSTIKYRL